MARQDQEQEHRQNFLSVLASYILPAHADRTPSVLATTSATFAAYHPTHERPKESAPKPRST